MNFIAAIEEQETSKPMRPERASGFAFFSISALLFVASALATIFWCSSMSGMGDMPMPGGWTMSMAWMLMPDQTWLEAAASFQGMWIVMMIAMMLPSLVPMLWRYRQAVEKKSRPSLSLLTASAGLGYFFVWSLFGMAIFPFGIVIASAEMQLPALARTVPVTVGVIVLAAGVLQLTPWKVSHLNCCRTIPNPGQTLPADTRSAWKHGMRLGLHCSYCCSGLITVLLVMGVMDLRTMAVVTAATTIERLAPAGEQLARAIGVAAVGTGLVLIVRAVEGL